MVHRLLSVLLFSFSFSSYALAQQKPKDPPKGGEGEQTFSVEETEGEPPAEQPTEPIPEPEIEAPITAPSKEETALSETRVSWQDIVVVKRKPFLKANRFELTPSVGRTLNDNMIKHTGVSAQINYYLTDVLAVGLEGLCMDTCAGKDFGETYELVARQDRRLPTLNKYNFGAALNFHYSPIYAKFAVFNKKIVHLEGLFTAGVGFTQTEIIPRDPALEPWKNNFLITPNVGFTMRVFLFDWVTLNLGVRDYIFIDKYEDVNRMEGQSVEDAMEEADSKLINHIMFSAGVSFWFPMSFEYTTFR